MRTLRFAAIEVLPLTTMAGLALGGGWNWLGLATYVVVYLVLDNVIPRDRGAPPASGGWAADVLLFAQVPLVYLAWLLFLRQFAPGQPFDGYDLAGAGFSLAVTFAIGGTVTAHELVHRVSSPVSIAAGRSLLAFIFDAAFAIEHVYGHHVRVGTREDPATARRGETLYAFVWRSTTRSFASAWHIETQRLARGGNGPWTWRNRNIRGVLMSLALVAVTLAWAGPLVALAFVLACLGAKVFLEMTNYVEHYGLVRVPGTAVAPRHSWDTLAPISAAGMFNLGRHAAHHTRATRPYWALAVAPGAPFMPAGLAASAVLATVPPLWFGIMNRKLRRWDREQASEAERALIRSAA